MKRRIPGQLDDSLVNHCRIYLIWVNRKNLTCTCIKFYINLKGFRKVIPVLTQSPALTYCPRRANKLSQRSRLRHPTVPYGPLRSFTVSNKTSNQRPNKDKYAILRNQAHTYINTYIHKYIHTYIYTHIHM